MEQQKKLKETTLQFFYDLFDLIVINILWMVCCLPIITIGPATCGMYRVTLKMAREEPADPVKDFFRGFKDNFKAGVLLELLCGLLLAATAGDAWFSLQTEGWIHTLYLVVAIIIGVVAMILVSYTFALQTMFDAPLKTHILNAFKLRQGCAKLLHGSFHFIINAKAEEIVENAPAHEEFHGEIVDLFALRLHPAADGLRPEGGAAVMDQPGQGPVPLLIVRFPEGFGGILRYGFQILPLEFFFP